MIKNIIQLFFLSALCACSSSNFNLSSDGKLEHAIYCSGRDSSWDACKTKAGEICGEEGYAELQKYQDEGAFAAYESAAELPERRLTIQCGK